MHHARRRQRQPNQNPATDKHRHVLRPRRDDGAHERKERRDGGHVPAVEHVGQPADGGREDGLHEQRALDDPARYFLVWLFLSGTVKLGLRDGICVRLLLGRGR